MRKPVYAICEQQRRRLACASVQSDQRLCCSLPGKYNPSTCYSRNFKNLASLCSCAGRFESYLVANPKDWFSRDEAHIWEGDFHQRSSSFPPPTAGGLGLKWMEYSWRAVNPARQEKRKDWDMELKVGCTFTVLPLRTANRKLLICGSKCWQ